MPPPWERSSNQSPQRSTDVQLNQLRVENLRNIRDQEIEPASGLNLITGPNGAGKTSLLEAVYLLSHARSFRTRRNDLLIRHGSEQLSIFGLVERAQGSVRLGLMQSAGRWVAKVDGQTPPALASMLRECAVVCFEPGSHALISGSSDERRRFIDWGVFHVEPNFVDIFRKYRRALQQRNSLLKQGSNATTAELDVWDQELVQAAYPLVETRTRYLERLGKALTVILGMYLPELGSATFQSTPGWNTTLTLSAALKEACTIDRLRGHTTRGPHRMDWSLRFRDVPHREQLSRGQEKLCAIACMLAQAELFHEDHAEWPMVVMDDLASELDPSHQQAVIASVLSKTAQIFMTGTEPPVVLSGQQHRQFHVEHGQIQALL